LRDDATDRGGGVVTAPFQYDFVLDKPWHGVINEFMRQYFLYSTRTLPKDFSLAFGGRTHLLNDNASNLTVQATAAALRVVLRLW
jgi:hypothetical protein